MDPTAQDRRERYLQSLERLGDALARVEEAIPGFLGANADIGKAVRSGAPLGKSLQDLHWPSIRRDLEESWTEFQQALYDTRCRSIRIMVDDEGWSLSEIARTRGLSRQLISRLYNDAFSLKESNSPS